MKLYCGNLPFTMDEAQLRALFEEHGEVQSAAVITDRDTGRSRGFGFVEMPDEAARTAMSALDDQPLDRSSRILITACSRTENSAQIWNDARTSVGDRWGKAPTLIEPVVADIRLPHAAESATLTAVGGDGKPLQKWTLTSTDGNLNVSLGDGPATLWYLLECE